PRVSPLSLHDALPISGRDPRRRSVRCVDGIDLQLPSFACGSAGGRRSLCRGPATPGVRGNDRRRAAGQRLERRMNHFARPLPTLLAMALMSGCASLAATGPTRPLTLDTHVDIPNDSMRVPHYAAGGDSALQVDLDKMRRGGMDAAFLVIYVGQGPLTPEGYADAVAKAERQYSAIDMLLANHPDRVRAAL